LVLDTAGGITSDSEEGTTRFPSAVEGDAAARELEAGVRPDLVAMFVEEASYVWMVRVNIDFAGSDDVGSYVAHVAEIV
jgi:hypothetical protein